MSNQLTKPKVTTDNAQPFVGRRFFRLYKKPIGWVQILEIRKETINCDTGLHGLVDAHIFEAYQISADTSNTKNKIVSGEFVERFSLCPLCQLPDFIKTTNEELQTFYLSSIEVVKKHKSMVEKYRHEKEGLLKTQEELGKKNQQLFEGLNTQRRSNNYLVSRLVKYEPDLDIKKYVSTVLSREHEAIKVLNKKITVSRLLNHFQTLIILGLSILVIILFV